MWIFGRLLLFGMLFLFEISFLSSFPWPLPFLPLIPAVSLSLFHEKGSWKDLSLLLLWGIGRDILGLSSWMPSTIIAGSVGLVCFYVSRRLLTHRSLYGFLGLGIAAEITWTFVDALARFFAPYDLSRSFHSFGEEHLLRLFLWLATMLVLSLGYIHVREHRSV